MYYLPYNKNLKQFSRDLRNNSTLGEVLLWNELKAGKMYGYKFNRQKPLGNYIVDFYCKKLSLVIEVDGSSHYTDEAYIRDQERQQILEDMGLYFLRFDDSEVKREMPNVLRAIEAFILDFEQQGGNPPGPLYEREICFMKQNSVCKGEAVLFPMVILSWIRLFVISIIRKSITEKELLERNILNFWNVFMWTIMINICLTGSNNYRLHLRC